MKIMVFTEGAVIMHKRAEGVSREERVKQSKLEGIQREEASINYNPKYEVPFKRGSIHDYANYIPNENAVEKLKSWKDQDAEICYLTSRRVKDEIDAIKEVLKRYDFPDYKNLYFRQQGENYADVAEKVMPDILIEDDCESIGGEKEMTYPHIRDDLKPKIKSVVVKEFGGIDHLPDNMEYLAIHL